MTARLLVPPQHPPIEKVVETRRREYPFRRGAHLFMKDGHLKKKDDRGGVGSEIVREVVVCPGCFEEPRHSPPKDVGLLLFGL
jgi:hypothetical protein